MSFEKPSAVSENISFQELSDALDGVFKKLKPEQRQKVGVWFNTTLTQSENDAFQKDEPAVTRNLIQTWSNFGTDIPEEELKMMGKLYRFLLTKMHGDAQVSLNNSDIEH